jgi:hypothetical protein
VNDDAVHVLVGSNHWIVTRVQPQLNARHSSLEAATEYARDVATRDRGVLLIHDALGAVAARESYRHA